MPGIRKSWRVLWCFCPGLHSLHWFSTLPVGISSPTFWVVTNWLSEACDTHASPNAIRIAWHNFYAMTWSTPQKTAGICQTLRRSLSPLQPLKFRGSGLYSNELGNMDVRMQNMQNHQQFMWDTEHHTASLCVYYIYIYTVYNKQTTAAHGCHVSPCLSSCGCTSIWFTAIFHITNTNM